MKKAFYFIFCLLSGFSAVAQTYTPSEEVKASQRDFAADRFGIFIHWGIYSMMGQGEWYLNYGPLQSEYSKAAKGFYPASFDAKEWARIFKDSGARYVTFTSRHHDGFSMWDTEQSPYNIVDATPYGRDVLGELSEALRDEGLDLHLYYSHIDWGRPDYPRGRTGLHTGIDPAGYDWPSYYAFMNRQLTELLTNYGPIRCIWFDGLWDHDADTVPFNWQLDEQYALIHKLQPQCMVANNHHLTPFPGEDMQIFERDVPGQNKAGLSGQEISQLPLETCQTMNGMWGYKIVDTNYKSADEIIRLLINTSGMGANLLLNIGPQPSGELPAMAVERLREVGEWLRANGETIYGTSGSDFPAQDWGTSTRTNDKVYLHITKAPANGEILVPKTYDIKGAKEFATGKSLDHRATFNGLVIKLGDTPASPDYIVELSLK